MTRTPQRGASRRSAILSGVFVLLVVSSVHAQHPQLWSDSFVLPSPRATSATPAPAEPQTSAPGTTQRWADPVYTKRRTDAENQGIVDRMVERARQDARAGRGVGLDHHGNAAAHLPDRLWQEHMARDRANEAFQGNEDEHYRRRKY
ncbi:hypothetical protein [Benzoatithermus flavus]|uniref:Uncharacterized protein n=1 Tax=Benzoatithermus flavus TaxID=3108223 RepID=A0ABU8XUK7_9PROT